MEKALTSCIAACEKCCCDCLKSGKSMNACVKNCYVNERVCKALSVAMKCGCDKEILKCLMAACKKTAKACHDECKKHNMKCCQDCAKCCAAVVNCCSKDLGTSSKKSSRKKSGRKKSGKKMKGGDCGKKHPA
jgi:hypothetical protein